MKIIRKFIVIAAVMIEIAALSGCSGMSTRDRNTVLEAGIGAIGGSSLTDGST